jgi:3-methyladenine DNA glycosylase AlkD
MPDRELVEAVRAALAAEADPARAVAAQRYMRSAMPFRGVPMPRLRRLVGGLVVAPEHRIADRPTYEATVLELWDAAAYREERYAATLLAGHPAYRVWQDPAALGLYRHLVTTGAWWDHVDDLASHHVGRVLAAHRAEVTPVMRGWAVEGDLWLRRAAVLCQLQHKADTDVRLLEEVLDANLLGSRFGDEFFVLKAVGWALRQHARVDPAWVRGYVASRDDRVSGLSRREALKHL